MTTSPVTFCLEWNNKEAKGWKITTNSIAAKYCLYEKQQLKFLNISFYGYFFPLLAGLLKLPLLH